MTQDVKIPKMLHFIWLGRPMPEHMERNVTAWQQMNPDWSAYLWSEKNIPELRHDEMYRRAENYVPRDAIFQFRSDLIRLELLYDFGGFYADTDTFPLRPLAEALAGREEFAAMEDRNWVGNTFLGATPRHPIIHRLIKGLADSAHRRRGQRPSRISGPRYLTPIWKTLGGYTAPSRQWYPYSYTDVKRNSLPDDYDSDVFAVHEWNHTREVMEARHAGA